MFIKKWALEINIKSKTCIRTKQSHDFFNQSDFEFPVHELNKLIIELINELRLPLVERF